MSEKLLTDEEAYERLHAALLALGREEGVNARTDTALKTARRAIAILQIGLLAAKDEGRGG